MIPIETITLIATLSVGFALALFMFYLMLRIQGRSIDDTNKRIESLEVRVSRLDTDIAKVRSYRATVQDRFMIQTGEPPQ